ncbi:hypothetical protein CDAR_120611 [Caerostris darwini]|uniref:Uncharacterized protein n=1 Tax=Caerostris darwini TaxID=1538125 RepID=A0AAV4S0Y1_9ARAC|nr:hypothetical protein CDAR_120601 [Caerostris darwini]GIY28193.1 hypothetical protein CDAR_120611 [Caerostris darwini]
MIAPATPFPGRPCSGFVIRPSVKQQTRMTPKELSSRQVSPERAQLSQLVFHPFPSRGDMFSECITGGGISLSFCSSIHSLSYP